MDLRMEVYSPALELLGVLEIQRSVIWEERAFSAGSFSLESLVSDESRALLTPENIIWIEGGTAGIIEYVLREASADGPYITVKGRTLTGILDRRILWGLYDLHGTPPVIMHYLVNDSCINPARGDDADSRKIPGLVMLDPPSGGEAVRVQKTGGTLLEALEEIGEAYGVAFGVRFNPKIPRMEFWTRWGQDRSIGQSVNEPVFYSTELDDVLSSEYSYNSTDYRNVSLVAGEGEGANRVFTTVIAQPTEPPPAPPTPPTPDTFTITLDVDPTGGGTASGGGTFKDGVSITVSAAPSPNYEFSGWREDGTIVSTNESYSFTVSKNRTLTAVFSSTAQTYTVTATVDPSGSGTVQGAGTYQAGATATIKATPGDGYKFTAWKEGGVVVSNSAEYSFTVNGNRAFVAAFESAAATVLNWQSITFPTSYPWSFACHGNGIFVISSSDELTSSYSRKMIFSLDGINFELSNSGYRSGTTGGIAYGNGLFVSPKCYKTSSTGSIHTMSLTSENGKTWAQNPDALQSNQWQSIACGKDADGEDLFVVVASNSKYVSYGKTGASWTRKTILPSAQDWIAVAYGGGEFVAISYDSDKAAHGPGITAAWVESTLPSSAKWRGLAYGGGKFVAVSEDGAIAYSSDGGNTWTSASVPETLALHCVAYGNGMFVVPAYGSDKYLYSENGVTWKIGNMPVSGNWKAITYGSGKFVAACYKSNAAAYAEF